MINSGDRVAVGVSGGKDSVALVTVLAQLRRYVGIPFELCAITLDPCFNGTLTDFSSVADYFAAIDVTYKIKRTDIGKIVFDIRKEKRPCSLCAVLRRGALHDTAIENNCNRIALGHHLDDAVETFYMNLFNEGRIGCFAPKSYLSRKKLWLIRPLIFATEGQVISAVTGAGLPIVKSRCPIDGTTSRQTAKEFVAKQAEIDPAFRQKMCGMLQESNLPGWNKSLT